MQITITGGPTLAGPSWEAVQGLLRSMFGPGKLTRIARRDGAANYRDKTGVYDVTFTSLCADEPDIPVTVTVN